MRARVAFEAHDARLQITASGFAGFLSGGCEQVQRATEARRGTQMRRNREALNRRFGGQTHRRKRLRRRHACGQRPLPMPL
jgi:hypothetical protein